MRTLIATLLIFFATLLNAQSFSTSFTANDTTLCYNGKYDISMYGYVVDMTHTVDSTFRIEMLNFNTTEHLFYIIEDTVTIRHLEPTYCRPCFKFYFNPGSTGTINFNFYAKK